MKRPQSRITSSSDKNMTLYGVAGVVDTALSLAVEFTQNAACANAAAVDKPTTVAQHTHVDGCRLNLPHRCRVVGYIFKSLSSATSCMGYRLLRSITRPTYLQQRLVLYTAPAGLCDRFPGKFSSIFVGMLSLGAWRSGLYLRRHDGFVASLWTLDAGLVW